MKTVAYFIAIVSLVGCASSKEFLRQKELSKDAKLVCQSEPLSPQCRSAAEELNALGDSSLAMMVYDKGCRANNADDCQKSYDALKAKRMMRQALFPLLKLCREMGQQAACTEYEYHNDMMKRYQQRQVLVERSESPAPYQSKGKAQILLEAQGKKTNCETTYNRFSKSYQTECR